MPQLIRQLAVCSYRQSRHSSANMLALPGAVADVSISEVGPSASGGPSQVVARRSSSTVSALKPTSRESDEVIEVISDDDDKPSTDDADKNTRANCKKWVRTNHILRRPNAFEFDEPQVRFPPKPSSCGERWLTLPTMSAFLGHSEAIA